jgi:hypothetical protein
MWQREPCRSAPDKEDGKVLVELLSAVAGTPCCAQGRLRMCPVDASIQCKRLKTGLATAIATAMKLTLPGKMTQHVPSHHMFYLLPEHLQCTTAA